MPECAAYLDPDNTARLHRRRPAGRGKTRVTTRRRSSTSTSCRRPRGREIAARAADPRTRRSRLLNPPIRSSTGCWRPCPAGRRRCPPGCSHRHRRHAEKAWCCERGSWSASTSTSFGNADRPNATEALRLELTQVKCLGIGRRVRGLSTVLDVKIRLPDACVSKPGE